jgi:zinc transporter ZupT
MAKSKSSRRKIIWYSSTVAVLLLIFIILFGVCWYLYGFSETIQIMLKYAVGMTATALFIAFIGFLLRKPLKKLFKKL